MQRDERIILFLARAEVASREQIQRLFFPSVATATRRLRRLTKEKLLHRYRPPPAAGGRLSGSAQFLYGLGSGGVGLAAEATGCHVRQPFRRGRPLGTLFLEHRLEVTEFMVRIIEAADERLVEWATGAALEDKVAIGCHPRRLAPDGYLVLQMADGSLRHALVEIDRGTMGRQAWLSKARAYQTYYRSGAYARRYATERLLLLVVVPDQQRRTFIRRVMATVRSVVMCFIATWPDIETHSATGPAWVRYDTGERCDLWIIPGNR